MPVNLVLTIGAIVLLDIVLSGDNALVIGAAASKLPRAQRALAIFWGGLVAVVLRITLASVATELFQVKYIQAIGGFLLLFVAAQVILPDAKDSNVHVRQGFFAAMATIVLADITMSLDNILAIAALANGQILALVIGLAISMLVLFTASAVIARLMDSLPWLLDLAGLVIAFTAAHLFLADPFVHEQFPTLVQYGTQVEIGVVAVAAVFDLIVRVVSRRAKTAPPPAQEVAVISEHHQAGNGAYGATERGADAEGTDPLTRPSEHPEHID